jgi:hypothetical protein
LQAKFRGICFLADLTEATASTGDIPEGVASIAVEVLTPDGRGARVHICRITI